MKKNRNQAIAALGNIGQALSTMPDWALHAVKTFEPTAVRPPFEETVRLFNRQLWNVTRHPSGRPQKSDANNEAMFLAVRAVASVLMLLSKQTFDAAREREIFATRDRKAAASRHKRIKSMILPTLDNDGRVKRPAKLSRRIEKESQKASKKADATIVKAIVMMIQSDPTDKAILKSAQTVAKARGVAWKDVCKAAGIRRTDKKGRVIVA